MALKLLFAGEGEAITTWSRDADGGLERLATVDVGYGQPAARTTSCLVAHLAPATTVRAAPTRLSRSSPAARSFVRHPTRLSRARLACCRGTVRSFCFSPSFSHLYVATLEVVRCFTVEASGDLRPAGEPIVMPSPPAYMSADKTGRCLLVASYNQPGHCCVLAVGSDGLPTGPPVSVHDDLRHTSHFIHTDPSNRFAFVPCVAAADHTNGTYSVPY